MAKLTPEQARAAHKSYVAGATCQTLALQYKCTPTCLYWWWRQLHLPPRDPDSIHVQPRPADYGRIRDTDPYSGLIEFMLASRWD